MYTFFLFKQKTAYEMRISDWSSDVCSSDLAHADGGDGDEQRHAHDVDRLDPVGEGLDVAAQRMLHVAQLAADPHGFLAEAPDRFALFVGQDGAALGSLAALDLAELFFRIAQLGQIGRAHV